MAERYVNYAAVVANILRGPVDEDAGAEAEAGVNTLAFLEIRCEELDCDPGEAAHFAVLDLSAVRRRARCRRTGPVAARGAASPGPRAGEGGDGQGRAAAVFEPWHARTGHVALSFAVSRQGQT